MSTMNVDMLDCENEAPTCQKHQHRKYMATQLLTVQYSETKHKAATAARIYSKIDKFLVRVRLIIQKLSLHDNKLETDTLITHI